jgi:nucleoporin SEH1
MSAIIHDVAYDLYGQRVATCSSDQCIRVYDAAGVKVAEWRAHSGSIWRLSWAHPEFGVALASCSFDRKVCVWEENADAEEAVMLGGSSQKLAQWQNVATISEARDSVVDVQFAPHHTGSLLLASCGADGMVRVHEAPDVLDLSAWALHSEFDASVTAVESAEALQASTAKAAAAETSAEGAAIVTSSGPLCLSGGTSGGPGGAGTSAGGNTAGAAAIAHAGAGGDGSVRLEPLCVAWGTSLVEAPMLVVGMSNGGILLMCYNEAQKTWNRSRAFEQTGGRCHLDCVRSVSWAADMGRSYQLIATASRDRTVKLWAVQRAQDADGTESATVAADRWAATCCAEMPHRSQVWRVSWNASGSMLASSEDDGSVRVFKMDSSGGWRNAAPLPLPGI